MTTYETHELEGALLDMAVAMAEGKRCILRHYLGDGTRPVSKAELVIELGDRSERTESYYPSSRWEIGGPIMEREGIATFSYTYDGTRYWAASTEGAYPTSRHGATSLLVAGMRAFVVSKLGDLIDISPDQGSTK